MKSTALSILIALAGATAAFAAGPYCAPKSDGTPRIPKTGTCPSGYFSSGNCCEAFRPNTPNAMPKIKGAACPSGYRASGDSCVAFR
jgi:hypothetical protein